MGPDADQRVLRRTHARREDGLRADEARAADRGRPPVHEHVHLRVGVVRDRHPAPSRERGRRARAEVHLSGLEARAAVVRLAPGDERRAVGAGVEAIERMVGDDEHAARLVDREGIADRLAIQRDGDDRAARGIYGAHDAVHADEPDAPVPVGQRGDDAVTDRDHRRHVVHPDDREARPERRRRLADDPDLPVGGRDHGPVELIEIEVPAAGEVTERRGAGRRRAGRQRHHGLGRERLRVDEDELGALDADANGHDAPRAVERERAALRALERRASLRRAAERPGRDVRVRHVGVVVDVAPAVRRHERMLRDPWRRDAAGHRGRAEERRDRVRLRALGDRGGWHVGRRGPRQDDDDEDERAAHHASGYS